MIRGFLTDAVRRLEICDRVGYSRRGIVRCLKNDNRTTRTLSYGARSICDCLLCQISRRRSSKATVHEHAQLELHTLSEGLSAAVLYDDRLHTVQFT